MKDKVENKNRILAIEKMFKAKQKKINRLVQ